MFVIGKNTDNIIDNISDKYFSCYIEKPKYYYIFNENKINTNISNFSKTIIKENFASFINETDKNIKPDEFNINNIKSLIINQQLNNYDWLKEFINVNYIFINNCNIDLNILTQLKNLKTLCISNCKNIILPKELNLERLSITNCNQPIIPNTYKNLKLLDIAEETYNLPNYLSSIEELHYYVNEFNNIPKEYINLKKIILYRNIEKYNVIDIFNYINYLYSNLPNLNEINIFNSQFSEKEFKSNINMLYKFKNKKTNFYASPPYEFIINNSIILYNNKEYNITYHGENIFARILYG